MPAPMRELNHDALLEIAKRVPTADLPNLRLSSRTLLAAVSDAPVSLRPSYALQGVELARLVAAFGKATRLDLSNCEELDDDSISCLQVWVL